MTLAEPRYWLLTVPALHGAGLPLPQLRIVIVNDVEEPPAAEEGLITAE